MCGEHLFWQMAGNGFEGSSPHVRGAHLHDRPRRFRPGIIPACAGSTKLFRLRNEPPRDHPRMCGEHPSMSMVLPLTEGSSPHVRGARAWTRWLTRSPGIIPACAGSTLLLASHRCRCRDHPRMCGEHHDYFDRLDGIEGSSPHVRGAPLACDVDALLVGIIPACAGSTMAVTRCRLLRWDHPRMCGEHRVRGADHCGSEGSSPHVRGALIIILTFLYLIGIIPACAGSTP